MVGYDYHFKVSVLGDVGVGKTVLEDYLRKVHPTPFDQSQRSTIGTSLNVLKLPDKDKIVLLEVWIISADKRSRFLLPSYLLSSNGVILLYDITNSSSINRLSEWIPVINKQCGSIPIVLVGNKVDLAGKRMVSKEEGLKFQKKHQLSSFMEISLKTGSGIAKMFEHIRDLIMAPFVKKK